MINASLTLMSDPKELKGEEVSKLRKSFEIVDYLIGAILMIDKAP
jgi:hypothetical protein